VFKTGKKKDDNKQQQQQQQQRQYGHEKVSLSMVLRVGENELREGRL
jgi:hypothetical protein